jgi:hypothetical protein
MVLEREHPATLVSINNLGSVLLRLESMNMRRSCFIERQEEQRR